MKTLTLTFLMLGVMAGSGMNISPFPGVDLYVEHGKDIVIADCVSLGTNLNAHGVHSVEVRIIETLKGDKPPGKLTIGTIYTMTPGKRYLLYSMGGSGNGIDFFAFPELSVVEISGSFDLKRLDGKPVTEQVSLLFADRLAHVALSLRELEEEKASLGKATKKQS